MKCVIAAAIVASLSTAAFAQEWTEFASREDGFSTNFPGAPTITQSTYRSQFGADLPARIYTATQGRSRFSVTVVDYRSIEKILTEKAKACPAGRRNMPRRGQSSQFNWRGVLEGGLCGCADLRDASIHDA